MNSIITAIRKRAIEKDWVEIDHQENIKMLSFTNGPSRINVYYSKMTVATVVNHPKLGRQTLYRRNVNFKQLAQLFENPRAHSAETGLHGYHKRAHA